MYGSLQLVMCPVWSPQGATLPWDQLPVMEKTYTDQLVTAIGDIYDKILASPSVGQNTKYMCNVWCKIKKFETDYRLHFAQMR